MSCDKLPGWYKSGYFYSEYCSSICANSTGIPQKRREEHWNEHYGGLHPSSLQEMQVKRRVRLISRYSKSCFNIGSEQRREKLIQLAADRYDIDQVTELIDMELTQYEIGKIIRISQVGGSETSACT